MPMQTNTNTSEAYTSPQEVPTLSRRLDWANNAYIGFLTLTLIASVLIVWYNKKLGWAKDIQQASELERVRGESAEHTAAVEAGARTRIAEVEAGAKKDAAEVRATAEKQIAEVRASADKEIAVLTAEADKAREGIATAQAEAGRANQAAGEANVRAEQEALKRVELEKSLSRRTIAYVGLGNGKDNLDSLKPFADMQAMIEYLPEREPYRAALSVAGALEKSGWKILGISPNPELGDFAWDGVTVEPYSPDRNVLFGHNLSETNSAMKAQWRAQETAEALVDFLGKNNWGGVHWIPSSFGELPVNTLRVRVGFKPEPHVPSAEEEEWFRRRDEELKKKEEEINAIRKKQGKEPIRLRP